MQRPGSAQHGRTEGRRGGTDGGEELKLVRLGRLSYVHTIPILFWELYRSTMADENDKKDFSDENRKLHLLSLTTIEGYSEIMEVPSDRHVRDIYAYLL